MRGERRGGVTAASRRRLECGERPARRGSEGIIETRSPADALEHRANGSITVERDEALERVVRGAVHGLPLRSIQLPRGMEQVDRWMRAPPPLQGIRAETAVTLSSGDGSHSFAEPERWFLGKSAAGRLHQLIHQRMRQLVHEKLGQLVGLRGGVDPGAWTLQEDLIAEGPGAKPRVPVQTDVILERGVIRQDADLDPAAKAPPAGKLRSRRQEPARDACRIVGAFD